MQSTLPNVRKGTVRNIVALGMVAVWLSCEGLSPLLAIRNKRAVDNVCATIRVGAAINAADLVQATGQHGIEERRVRRISLPEVDVIMIGAPLFLMVTRECWIELEAQAGTVKKVRNFTREP